MKYTCPVCGYNELEDPPARYTICPSCGTEFEYDDDDVSHEELRQRWIANGAKWWSIYDVKPQFWSPIEQLENIHYQVTDTDRLAIASTQQAAAQEMKLAAEAYQQNGHGE